MFTRPAERLRELLHYDPETGVFTRAVTRRAARAGEIAGCVASTGHRKFTIDSGRIFGVGSRAAAGNGGRRSEWAA
jgi:hypothetical protein